MQVSKKIDNKVVILLESCLNKSKTFILHERFTPNL